MTATAPAPTIELRGWNSADWPICWSWLNRYYWKVADDYAPKTLQEFVDASISRGSRNFGVYRNGELGGLIMFDRLSPYLCECHVYFKRSFWGWATTVPALQLARRWATTEGGYSKCTSPIFESNQLMVKLAERLGFIQEAFFRAHTTQRGKPVNVLYFSYFARRQTRR